MLGIAADGGSAFIGTAFAGVLFVGRVAGFGAGTELVTGALKDPALPVIPLDAVCEAKLFPVQDVLGRRSTPAKCGRSETL